MASIDTIDAQCRVCKKDGKGTYITEAHCLNCDWEGTAVHSLGHDKNADREGCPRCGCRFIRMGLFIDEEPSHVAPR